MKRAIIGAAIVCALTASAAFAGKPPPVVDPNTYTDQQITIERNARIAADLAEATARGDADTAEGNLRGTEDGILQTQITALQGAKTKTVNLSALAFLPAGTNTRAILDACVYGVSSSILYADLPVPVGATITAFSVSALVASGYTAYLSLLTHDSYYDDMQVGFLAATTPDPSEIRVTVSQTLAPSETVDANEFFKLKFSANGVNTARICGASVTYTEP
jgi:opacity protein-like surface antigen